MFTGIYCGWTLLNSARSGVKCPLERDFFQFSYPPPTPPLVVLHVVPRRYRNRRAFCFVRPCKYSWRILEKIGRRHAVSQCTAMECKLKDHDIDTGICHRCTCVHDERNACFDARLSRHSVAEGWILWLKNRVVVSVCVFFILLLFVLLFSTHTRQRAYYYYSHRYIPGNLSLLFFNINRDFSFRVVK